MAPAWHRKARLLQVGFRAKEHIGWPNDPVHNGAGCPTGAGVLP